MLGIGGATAMIIVAQAIAPLLRAIQIGHVLYGNDVVDAAQPAALERSRRSRLN